MFNEKMISQLITSVFIVSMILPLTAYSEKNKSSAGQKTSKPISHPVKKTGERRETKQRILIYIPPKPEKPAPGIRISTGGTRGSDTDLAVVTLLVPEHVGVTFQAQPTLYWHLSEPTNRAAVTTVINPNGLEPLLEITQKGPIAAGVHAVNLADQGKRLDVGVLYEWSVSLLANGDQPSSDDLIARGFIEMQKPTVDFERQLAQKSVPEKAALYAREGVWYDVLSVLSREEPSSKRERKKVLEQVGLVFSNQVDQPHLAASVSVDADFD